MPQVSHSQSWIKTHPVVVWGGAGLLLLGGGAVAAVVSLGLVGTKKASSTPSPQKQVQKYLGMVNAPTSEQIRAAKNTIHAEGKISAITATTLTLMPTGQTKPVTLKLSGTTIYSSGKQGRTADKASLRPGQAAILSYDSSANTVISLWAGYNE